MTDYTSSPPTPDAKSPRFTIGEPKQFDVPTYCPACGERDIERIAMHDPDRFGFITYRVDCQCCAWVGAVHPYAYFPVEDIDLDAPDGGQS